MNSLEGKVAVVTGGCSGIGLGTVERFVREGARVVVGDIDDAAGAAIADRFEGAVAYTRCDVRDEAQIEALMASAVARFGGLDVVFNNAGAGGADKRIDELSGEDWDRTHSLLLRAVALGIRHAAPHMKVRGGGSIINTSSIAGVQSGAGSVAYSSAKAGVIHLTRVAAAELARDGIRVNAVCPGLIITNIFVPTERVPAAVAPTLLSNLERFAPEAQPIKKAGLPSDVANAVLFFASDQSAFITGEHLMVDGGLFVGPRHSWDPAAKAQRQRELEALARPKQG